MLVENETGLVIAYPAEIESKLAAFVGPHIWLQGDRRLTLAPEPPPPDQDSDRGYAVMHAPHGKFPAVLNHSGTAAPSRYPGQVVRSARSLRGSHFADCSFQCLLSSLQLSVVQWHVSDVADHLLAVRQEKPHIVLHLRLLQTFLLHVDEERS